MFLKLIDRLLKKMKIESKSEIDHVSSDSFEERMRFYADRFEKAKKESETAILESERLIERAAELQLKWDKMQEEGTE